MNSWNHKFCSDVTRWHWIVCHRLEETVLNQELEFSFRKLPYRNPIWLLDESSPARSGLPLTACSSCITYFDTQLLSLSLKLSVWAYSSGMRSSRDPRLVFQQWRPEESSLIQSHFLSKQRERSSSQQFILRTLMIENAVSGEMWFYERS